MTIVRRGAALALTLEDVWGRKSERIVTGVATAAALVESWARTDLSAPLLGPSSDPAAGSAPDSAPDSARDVRPARAPVATPTPAAAAPPAPAARAVSAADPEVPFGLLVDASASDAVAPARSLRGSFFFSTEGGAADDGSAWIGARTGACVRLGPTCVGVLARFAHDARPPDRGGATETHRVAADLFLALDFPLALGPLRVTPGFALGMGVVHSARRSAPDGPEAEVNSGGARGETHLTLALPLGGSVALELGVSASAALPAHTAPFDENAVRLAGEPRAFLRAGLGLRVGAP